MNSQRKVAKHVLTIIGPHSRIEVHVLNPRESMPGFGGSRSGLLVGKTASIVTRTIQNGMQTDVERDIHDTFFWKYIVDAINGEFEGVHAIEPSVRARVEEEHATEVSLEHPGALSNLPHDEEEQS